MVMPNPATTWQLDAAEQWFADTLVSGTPGAVLSDMVRHEAKALAAAERWIGKIPGHVVRHAADDMPPTKPKDGWKVYRTLVEVPCPCGKDGCQPHRRVESQQYNPDRLEDGLRITAAELALNVMVTFLRAVSDQLQPKPSLTDLAKNILTGGE